jgi:hypothetical protein
MRDLISELRDAGEAYAGFLEGLSDEQYRRRPSPDEWSNVELAGHVAEAPLTFALVAVDLSREPGRQIGRQLEDPVRLEALTTMASSSPQAAARVIRDNINEAAAALKQIPDEAWDVRGSHVRFGEMSVRELVGNVIVGHVREHLAQARQVAGLEADG